MTIDIGNTGAKISVFDGETPVFVIGARPGGIAEAVRMELTLNHIEGIVYSCVGRDEEQIADTLEQEGEIPVLRLGADTPLPIIVEYGSRETLGSDRVATAVAVGDAGPTLVVDAGTAITSDLVDGGVFKGGNIAPGLRMRFEALHRNTAALPRVEAEGELPLIGTDTQSAIRCGVVRGAAAEIAMLYAELRREYHDLALVLTGGDAAVLSGLLESYGINHRVEPNLLGIGLVKIYQHNNRT